VCGISETPERSSETETIYGTQTISGMGTVCETQTMSETETIISDVTGKDMFSHSALGIGMAIGTAIATIGGMVTDARSLMERG
jgi:hypothetical protein